MTTITVHQAKTQLSRLIARAEAGEEIVIARGRHPVARLVGLGDSRKRPKFGALQEQWPALPDTFWFDPLPEDELTLWERGDEAPPR